MLIDNAINSAINARHRMGFAPVLSFPETSTCVMIPDRFDRLSSG